MTMSNPGMSRIGAMYFFHACFFLALIGCTSEVSQEIPTIQITGTVLNHDKFPNSKFVALESFHSCGGYAKYRAKIDSTGSFSIDIASLDEAVYKLSPFSDVFTYAEPGDNIHMVLDLDRPSQIEFSGDNKTTNQTLATLSAEGFLMETLNSVPLSKLHTYNPDEFIKKQKKERDWMLSNLDKKRGLIDSKSFEILQSRTSSHYYDNLMHYGLSSCGLQNWATSKEEEIQLKYKFFISIENELNQDISSLGFGLNSQSFVDSYLNYLIYDNEKGDSPIIPMTERLHHYLEIITSKDLPPSFKDRLIIRFIEHHLADYQLPLIENNQEYIKSKFSNEEARQRLMIRILNEKNKRLILEEYDIEKTFLADIINKESDKYVYIDFWALWCGPCLAELKKWKEWINEVNTDQVSFYTICMSDDKACQKFVEENQVPGIHLTIGEEEVNQVIRELSIGSALPYQFLINPQGKVVREGRIRINSLDSYIASLSSKAN